MRVYNKILLVILLMVSVTALAVYYPNTMKYLNVTYSELTTDAQKQVTCLADNIYHEAGYEPEDGKIAVALVTMNRVNDDRFPKDICSVVKQKVNTTCQFSWFCMNVTNNKNNPAYVESLTAALWVYANYEQLEDITKGAIYYHADYVNPQWKLKKTTKIGRHIFYKDNYDAKTEPTVKGRTI